MSTGYSWEGIRQVRATLLGARHVPERLCGGYVYLGRYISVRPLPFTFTLLTYLLSVSISTFSNFQVLVYVGLEGDRHSTFG